MAAAASDTNEVIMKNSCWFFLKKEWFKYDCPTVNHSFLLLKKSAIVTDLMLPSFLQNLFQCFPYY